MREDESKPKEGDVPWFVFFIVSGLFVLIAISMFISSSQRQEIYMNGWNVGHSQHNPVKYQEYKNVANPNDYLNTSDEYLYADGYVHGAEHWASEQTLNNTIMNQ